MAGRISRAAQEFQPVKKDGRIMPPTNLTEDECKVWDAVVATKPIEWFTADNAILLETYCSATVRQRWLEERTHESQKYHDSFDDHEYESKAEARKELKDFLKWGKENYHVLANVATKLRLTPQARYETKVAANAANKVGGELKPWDFAGEKEEIGSNTLM